MTLWRPSDICNTGSDAGSGCRGSPELIPLQDSMEQMWGDAGYRENREPTVASGSVQLCWAQPPAGVSLKPQDSPAVVRWKVHLLGITNVI